MPVTREHRTAEEWEVVLGEQVRNARVVAGFDQRRLSVMANVSIRSVSNLERGKGSSIRTLVAVVRALGRTDWLEALGPNVTISPVRMLRGRGTTAQRVRGASDGAVRP